MLQPLDRLITIDEPSLPDLRQSFRQLRACFLAPQAILEKQP